MLTLLLGMAAVAGLSSAPATAAATVAGAVSTNWSGYAVGGASCSAVTGSWVQPAASCTRGSSGYSAFWVGLGGFAAASGAAASPSAVSADGSAFSVAWQQGVALPRRSRS